MASISWFSAVSLVVLLLKAAGSLGEVARCWECIPDISNDVDCYNAASLKERACDDTENHACIRIDSAGEGMRGCAAEALCSSEPDYYHCCNSDLCNNDDIRPAEAPKEISLVHHSITKGDSKQNDGRPYAGEDSQKATAVPHLLRTGPSNAPAIFCHENLLFLSPLLSSIYIALFY